MFPSITVIRRRQRRDYLCLNFIIIVYFLSAHLENQSNLSFRLSPNIVQFIQPSGNYESLWKSSSQPYTSSMIATGHVIYWCKNNLMALIRALLRDYFVLWHKFLINNYQNKEMYPLDLENSILEKWLSSATEQIYNRISGGFSLPFVFSDDICIPSLQTQVESRTTALSGTKFKAP